MMYYALLILWNAMNVALASEDAPAQMQLFARGGLGVRDLVVVVPADATLLDLKEEIKRMTKEHEEMGKNIDLNTEISFQGRYFDDDGMTLADLGISAEAEIGYFHTRKGRGLEKIKRRPRGWTKEEPAVNEIAEQWPHTQEELEEARRKGMKAGFDWGYAKEFWIIDGKKPGRLKNPYDFIYQTALREAFWEGTKSESGIRAGRFAGECAV